MYTKTLSLAGFAALTAFSFSAIAQTSAVSGGQSGYDESLEAIEPTDEPVKIGLAGDDPADIARYILAANGGVNGGQLSPDGETIAFGWSITGERQIWTVPATGGQPRRLTYGNGVSFFVWAPDGEHILYGADNDGDEQEAYFLISADGTEEELLFPAEAGAFRIFGDYAPDGDSIIYSSTARTGLHFDIYKADVPNGESEMIFEGEFGVYPSDISPDGQYITFSTTVGEDSNNLYLLDLDTGDVITVSEPERRAAQGSVSWLDDSSGFYFSSNTEREYSAVHFYDVQSGTFELTHEVEGSDIDGISLCGADDAYLVHIANVGGYSDITVINRDTGDRIETPDLPEGVYGVSCNDESARMVLGVNGWRTPGSFITWDIETDTVYDTFIAPMAGLDPDRLVRPEDVRIEARDGLELQGLLYLPDETSHDGQDAPPVVFMVHGGPTSQLRPTFDAQTQYLVDRGFAVFESNVRGSTGFGHTYVTLDDRENRLESIADLVDMLNYLGEEGLVDAVRSAVVGGSYGGYAVNAVLANFPGNFAAGVSLFGVADWVTALEIASPALKASDRIEYGDITDPYWKDYYTKNSPIRQADQINVPVLYSHGVKDPRIDIMETEVMVKTLRENGVRADFIRIPDEGHGWRKLSNQLFYARAQAEFLEDVLGMSATDEDEADADVSEE